MYQILQVLFLQANLISAYKNVKTNITLAHVLLDNTKRVYYIWFYISVIFCYNFMLNLTIIKIPWPELKLLAHIVTKLSCETRPEVLVI